MYITLCSYFVMVGGVHVVLSSSLTEAVDVYVSHLTLHMKKVLEKTPMHWTIVLVPLNGKMNTTCKTCSGAITWVLPGASIKGQNHMKLYIPTRDINLWMREGTLFICLLQSYAPDGQRCLANQLSHDSFHTLHSAGPLELHDNNPCNHI